MVFFSNTRLNSLWKGSKSYLNFVSLGPSRESFGMNEYREHNVENRDYTPLF